MSSPDPRATTASLLRNPRRWPPLLVGTALASALAITALLALQDRENALAASSAHANFARDAVAYDSLEQVAQSIELASSLQRMGILGLQRVSANDFQSIVVSRLGGTLVTMPGQWTLALGGGWACLSWPQSASWRILSVSRGVCRGAPIVRTPSVTAAALAVAVRCIERRQRAALDAAHLAATVASTPRRTVTRFSIASLADHFFDLNDADFRAQVTPGGLLVMSKTSAACLRPSSTERLVRIGLGPCP